MMRNPEIEDKSFIIKLQDNIEKLNLLGNYINRTRRVQVAERRAIRSFASFPWNTRMRRQCSIKHHPEACPKTMFPGEKAVSYFQDTRLQLRAASCLPAMADEIKSGIHGDMDDLVSDAVYFEGDGEWEDEIHEEYDLSELRITDYDFEQHDSKYAALLDMLEKTEGNEKIIIFAFYRSTLAYLSRRLKSDGYRNSVIHGGINNASRWEAIENFKESQDVKILLSSEVGSEGIDLQFCRILVNYDLP